MSIGADDNVSFWFMLRLARCFERAVGKELWEIGFATLLISSFYIPLYLAYDPTDE